MHFKLETSLCYLLISVEFRLFAQKNKLKLRNWQSFAAYFILSFLTNYIRVVHLMPKLKVKYYVVSIK